MKMNIVVIKRNTREAIHRRILHTLSSFNFRKNKAFFRQAKIGEELQNNTRIREKGKVFLKGKKIQQCSEIFIYFFFLDEPRESGRKTGSQVQRSNNNGSSEKEEQGVKQLYD